MAAIVADSCQINYSKFSGCILRYLVCYKIFVIFAVKLEICYLAKFILVILSNTFRIYI